MEIIDFRDIDSSEFRVDTLLELLPIDEGRASIGVATFKSGMRHPEQGLACHEQHEISFIIEGSFDLHTEEGTTVVEAGQLVYLMAGEQHATTAKGNGKVYYVLYG